MRWPAMQANDEGTVRLDPRKLAQFCKQLQHIQKKVVRLQAERLANSQREDAIKAFSSPLLHCRTWTIIHLTEWNGFNWMLCTNS